MTVSIEPDLKFIQSYMIRTIKPTCSITVTLYCKDAFNFNDTCPYMNPIKTHHACVFIWSEHFYWSQVAALFPQGST